MEKKTPLYGRHTALGGDMVPFAGYLLPMQYPTGILAEHEAVRRAAGVFDVSHMGRAVVSGPGAQAALNAVLTNDFTGMAAGAARYALMLYEDGGAIDDLIVCRLSDTAFLLVLNAANTARDLLWLREHLPADAHLTDETDETAQLALQGPDSERLLAGLLSSGLLPARYYTFREHCRVAGADCLAARTGYTGEDGFELYLRAEDAPAVWDALLAAGAVPCGLGARDTLRLEAGMPLYGHELDEKTDPLTAGLGFAVKLGKPDFIGRAALLAMGAPARKRVGLTVTGRGIIRGGEELFAQGVSIGRTTSGTFCPHLGVGCAMAYVDADRAVPGAAVEADVRGRRVPARLVALPFYKRPQKA